MNQEALPESELELVKWDTDLTNSVPPGTYRSRLKESGHFDILVIGGGGGGSGSRARKEGSTGGGGNCADFSGALDSKWMEAGDYLIIVGAGGSGGLGSLNHAATPAQTKGVDGEDSGIWRLLPPGTIPILVSKGGSGGQELVQATIGQAGRDCVDPAAPANTPPIGKGGAGGTFGGIHHPGGNGEDAKGFGAGGGGQGAGLTQIDDGKIRGGHGSDGIVVLVRRS